MQTPQTLSPETVRAILESPATQAALAAQEAARTRERSEILAALTAAELTAAVVGDEHNAKLGPLETAFRVAQATADTARGAWARAVLEANSASATADAKISALRGRLGPLGDDKIAEARHALALEKRIAEGTLSWRAITEPGPYGATTRTIEGPGNPAARELILQIDAALLELDTLECAAGKGPAQIAERLAAMRAEIDGAKAGAPVAKRGAWALPHGDVAARRQVATMSSRTQR